MARMIDADALLVKQANIAKTFARSDAQKSLMGRVMYNTEHAPTIDAITVEWLEDKELDYRTTGDKMFSDAFAVVLGEWQKEQGAQDE